MIKFACYDFTMDFTMLYLFATAIVILLIFIRIKVLYTTSELNSMIFLQTISFVLSVISLQYYSTRLLNPGVSSAKQIL